MATLRQPLLSVDFVQCSKNWKQGLSSNSRWRTILERRAALVFLRRLSRAKTPKFWCCCPYRPVTCASKQAWNSAWTAVKQPSKNSFTWNENSIESFWGLPGTTFSLNRATHTAARAERLLLRCKGHFCLRVDREAFQLPKPFKVYTKNLGNYKSPLLNLYS